MFETGNVVLHPTEGVCEIDDVRSERFDGSKKRTYYVMHPLYAKIKSTLFVPVDSDKILLQKMPTKEEIIELIKSVSITDIEWIENSTLRKDAFMHIIYNGDTKEIVALIAKLHIRKNEVEANGKKFSATDSKILKEAEKKVYQEFSYVLDTDEENIQDFILKYLNI